MKVPPDWLLAAIKSRPAMYFGTHRSKFSSIRAFLFGYAFGFDDGVKNARSQSQDSIPEGFRKFVAGELGIDPDLNVGGWYPWILDHTESEDVAFELIFELLDEFTGECMQGE